MQNWHLYFQPSHIVANERNCIFEFQLFAYVARWTSTVLEVRRKPALLEHCSFPHVLFR